MRYNFINDCTIRKIYGLMLLFLICFITIISYARNSNELTLSHESIDMDLETCKLEIEKIDGIQFDYIDPYNKEFIVFPAVKEVISTSNISYILSLNSDLKIHFVWENSTYKIQQSKLMTDVIGRHCGNWKSKSVTSKHPVVNPVHIDSVEVEVRSSLDEHGDEAYAIEILHNKITISISSIRGIYTALSTLSQLVNGYSYVTIPLIIRDWPQYSWRGLMVDVSRHYIPIPQLLKTVDGMSLSRFNILHMHLTDSQAFPVQFKDTPKYKLSQLSKVGSHITNINTTYLNTTSAKIKHMLSNYETEDLKVYKLYQLKRIVQYATDRGIEVIPELDVPAHSRSWGNAFPEIIVQCHKAANRNENPGNVYALDPSHPDTMEIIREILIQIANTFPSVYIHVGGDEVILDCWRESKTLMSWATSKNMTLTDVFRTFMGDVFAIVTELGKIPITWQGVIDMNALPDILPNTSSKTYYGNSASIIEPWKCWSGLSSRAAEAALSRNHPVVVATCWYLDWDSDWNDFLKEDRVDEAKKVEIYQKHSQSSQSRRTSTDKKSSNSNFNRELQVLGGEGAMWTEHVDYTNFDCRVWPRAASIGAALWGFTNNTSYVQLVTDMSNRRSFDNVPRNISSSMVETTVALMKSYVHISYYLLNRLKINIAIPTWHKKSVTGEGYFPVSLSSHVEINKVIAEDSQSAIPSDFIKQLTTQCPLIPEPIQRPIRSNVIKIAQINVGDGASGHRGKLLTQWLSDKANEGFTFIGLCEINGWHNLQSTSNIKQNFQQIVFKAADAGFVYSHVLVSDSHPYNLGLVSSIPFVVIKEVGPPMLQRGMIHVYFPSINLHSFIVHLHAQSSELRYIESNYITSIIKPLLISNSRVVLMGDMNTLSPDDISLHKEENLENFFYSKKTDLFIHLQKKFCDSKGHIDYSTIQNFLSIGLQDSCTLYCRNMDMENITNYARRLRSSTSTESLYDICMKEKCRSTEPTLYNPEWPRDTSVPPFPLMRLDFLFVSDSIVASTTRKGRGSASTSSLFVAGIDHNQLSAQLSDHFPVFVAWIDN